MIGKKVFETEEQLQEALADSDCRLKKGDYVVINDKYCRICRPTTERLKKKKQGIIFYAVVENDTTPTWSKVVS